MVEHLPFERVIALLDEAARVLRPGGLIVVETPNPENLAVAHHLFYMDPTSPKSTAARGSAVDRRSAGLS